MTYDYTIKIDLDEKEKEAIRTLSETYSECMIDNRIECEDCPFYRGDPTYCLPKVASLFEIKKGKQL